MSRALHFPQVPTDYCNYSQILYHFTYSSSVPQRDYVCRIHREVETLSALHITRANFSRKVLFRFRCPGFAFMHFIIINNTRINTNFFSNIRSYLCHFALMPTICTLHVTHHYSTVCENFGYNINYQHL